MKTLNQFIFYILFFTVFSCQKAKFEKASTISDLIHYTACAMTPCGEAITHENEDYFLQGTIYKINVFKEENRFIAFETTENNENNRAIEVVVTKNQKTIFDKINRFIDKNESVKIYLRAKIKGRDLPVNGNCIKDVYLEIDHTTDIRF